MNEIVSQQEGSFPIPENLVNEVQFLRDQGETEQGIKEFIRLNEPVLDAVPATADDAPEKADDVPVATDQAQELTGEEEPGVLSEMGRGILQGTEKAMSAAYSLVPVPGGMTAPDGTPITNLNEALEGADQFLGGPVDVNKPTTTTGKVTSAISQVLLGAIPAMRMVKAVGVSNVFVQTVFGGAIGDFVVGDEDLAKGLLSLVDSLPAEYGGETADKIVDIIDEWAMDQDKGGYDDLKSRTINAIGGIPIAGAADRIIKLAGIAAKSGSEALKSFRDTLSTRLRGEEAPATIQFWKSVTDGTATRSLADAHSVVGSRISRDAKPRKGAPVFSEMYRLFIDRFNPIKKLQDDLAAGRELPINMRPYEQTRLQVSAMNKANLFLEHEIRSFKTGEVVGRGLKKIMEPLKGDGQGLREFSNYAVAKRALELMNRPKPIKTGYEADRAALEKVVRETGERFEPIFREVVEYQNNVLNYLKDSGVLSKDMVKAIQEANKDYVPFFRIMDDEATGGLAKNIFNPLKKIKGSEREIVDPLESIIKNTYAFVQLAERNQVIKSLHDLAKSSPRGKELVKVLPAKTKPIKIKGEELETAIQKADPESAMLDVLKQYAGADAGKILPDEISIFRAMAAPERSNTVSYMNKGKRVTLELDEDVARSLKDMDNNSINLLTRIFSVPAKTLRAGAILDPEFFVRNAMRDNVTAAVYSANGFRPWLQDFYSGFKSLKKKDKHYRDWLFGGGAQATLVSMDRQYLRENLSKLMDSADMYTTVRNVVKSPLEILRVATEFAENATRIGEFKRAMKGGPQTKEAMQEAAFGAREITLDFARRGAATKSLNMLSAFLNARIQGYDRMVRAMVNNPIRTNAKAAMYITTPSVLLWMHNNSTDERAELYRAVPEWQKNLFWVVIRENGDHFRIPKPFELGVLYGSVPERILDAWKGNRKFEDLADDIPKALGLDLRSLIGSVMPTAAGPVIEDETNWSFFRGRDLEPGSLSNPQTAPLPQDRYTLYTSETAKKISELFGDAGIPVLENMSPIELENYISQWTGGLGRKFLELIVEPTGRALDVLPERNLPLSTLADIPFVKGFAIRHRDRNSQPSVDFYRRSDDTMKWVNSYKKRKREADLDGINRLMKADGGKLMSAISVESFIRDQRRFLSETSNQIGIIYKHPDMDKTEKRINIDNLLIIMHDTSVNANKILDLAEESRKTWQSTVTP